MTGKKISPYLEKAIRAPLEEATPPISQEFANNVLEHMTNTTPEEWQYDPDSDTAALRAYIWIRFDAASGKLYFGHLEVAAADQDDLPSPTSRNIDEGQRLRELHQAITQLKPV